MLCLYVQYVFYCELFSVLFSNHIWGQPAGWRLAQGWFRNPESSAEWEQLWGDIPKCEQSSVMNLKCCCSLVQNSSGKQFSRWELRDALERNLLWRWTAHLLMESFRQAASVCKSLSCNTFVSVASSPEVHLFILNTASLFYLFCGGFFSFLL